MLFSTLDPVESFWCVLMQFDAFWCKDELKTEAFTSLIFAIKVTSRNASNVDLVTVIWQKNFIVPLELHRIGWKLFKMLLRTNNNPWLWIFGWKTKPWTEVFKFQVIWSVFKLKVQFQGFFGFLWLFRQLAALLD